MKPGDRVTGNDAACSRFGKIGIVMHLVEDEAIDIMEYHVKWDNGDLKMHHRHQLRLTTTKPISAQIGFGAVWEDRT